MQKQPSPFQSHDRQILCRQYPRTSPGSGLPAPRRRQSSVVGQSSRGAAARKELVCKSTRGSPAVSMGGGTGGASGGGGGLGGGDGSDDNGRDDSGLPSRGWVREGWQARVAADPLFTYKVLVEQIIGVGAAVLGDMSSRPYWGLYELDFVFSTIVVGSLVNLSLMYLLAPTAASTSSAAGGSSLLNRIFGDSTLKAWGAPGGHMFQTGYPLKGRILNLLYKGGVFAIVGLAAGLVGTAASNALIAIRKSLDPNFEPQNALPSVPLNAACWATHMGISSNVRYQVINGLEMALQPQMPGTPFRVLTSIVRTSNNLVGGMSFVLLAKVMGVQQSQGDEVKEHKKAQSSAE